MSRCTVSPATISGKLVPPPCAIHASKLIWAAILGEGGAIGNCPDTPAIRSIIDVGRQLGADIEFEDGVADIFPPRKGLFEDAITCPDLGSARMAAPLAIAIGGSRKIALPPLPASASMGLDQIASDLGVRIAKTPGVIEVSGETTGDGISLHDVPGAFWAPGFAMATPMLPDGLVIEANDFVTNRPSFRMSLGILDTCKIPYVLEESEGMLTIAPSAGYPGIYEDAEQDWRSGSYMLGALALAGSGEVELSHSSIQPEAQFWGIAKDMEDLSQTVGLSADCSVPISLPESIDLRRFPSLLPLVMIMASRNSHPVRIEPVYPNYAKFMKQAKAMAAQMSALGAKVEVEAEYVEVSPSQLSGGHVDCQNDSRIAMALGIAGLIASDSVIIENAHAASRACPSFWQDLRSLGAPIALD